MWSTAVRGAASAAHRWPAAAGRLTVASRWAFRNDVVGQTSIRLMASAPARLPKLDWTADNTALGGAPNQSVVAKPKRRERPHISSVTRRMLAALPEDETHPDVVSLRALLQKFLKEQPEVISTEWAERVISLIKAGTLRPNVEFYHFAMSVYAHDNQSSKALSVVDQMRDAKVPLNALTCCSLMLNMTTCSAFDRAKILSTVIRLLSTGEVAHVSSLHIKLLKCVRDAGDNALLDFVLYDLSGRWWRHLVTTQSFLIQALCKTQRLDEAIVTARTMFTQILQGVQVVRPHPTLETKTELKAPFGERLTMEQLQDRILTSLDEILERLPPRPENVPIGVDLVDQAYLSIQGLTNSARIRELFAVRLLTFTKSALSAQAFWPMRFSEEGLRTVDFIHYNIIEPTLDVFTQAAAARGATLADADANASAAAAASDAAETDMPGALPQISWLSSLEPTSYLGSAMLSSASWVDLHRGSDHPGKPLGQRALDALMASGIFSPETFNAMASAIARDVTKPRARERLSTLLSLLEAYRATGNKPGIRLYTALMQSMVPRQSLGLYNPQERARQGHALTYAHLRRLQQMMEADGVKHDKVSMTLMLRCLSYVRQWRALVELFRLAPLIGCTPDAFMCFVALQGAFFSGRQDTANEILHIVKLWLPSIVGPPAPRQVPVSFHRWFVLGSIMAQDVDGARKYITETALPSLTERADADVIHSAFIHGCLDIGRTADAELYLEELLAAGGPATSLPYVAFFKHYSRFHRSLHASGDQKEIVATERLYESLPPAARFDTRVVEEVAYSRAILQNKLHSAIDLVTETAQRGSGNIAKMPLPSTIHLLVTAAEELDPNEVSLVERASIDKRIASLVASLHGKRARGTAEQEDDIADFVDAARLSKPKWSPPRSRRFQRRLLPGQTQQQQAGAGEEDAEPEEELILEGGSFGGKSFSV